MKYFSIACYWNWKFRNFFNCDLKTFLQVRNFFVDERYGRHCCGPPTRSTQPRRLRHSLELPMRLRFNIRLRSHVLTDLLMNHRFFKISGEPPVFRRVLGLGNSRSADGHWPLVKWFNDTWPWIRPSSDFGIRTHFVLKDFFVSASTSGV